MAEIMGAFAHNLISTHAPAGGATWDDCDNRPRIAYFYSRPCGRGDKIIGEFTCNRVTISTHAPAGGATLQVRRESADEHISTHAPAGGATRARRSSGLSFSFLLTPLREGRPSTGRKRSRRANFYSRPCGRGDLPVLLRTAVI